MDTTDSFGYWVRRQRKALDLTQAELARRAGCAEVTLRKIEADERRPSRPMAERLAECLGLAEADRVRFVTIAVGTQAAIKLPLSETYAARRLPGNLPAPVTSLVGRDGEIETIVDGLQRGGVRLLTLTGPVGVGKSRLAVAVGRRLMGAYRHGVYLIALAATQQPDAVPAVIADALAVREGRRQNLDELVMHFLASREMLLIFDNFEHLLPATPFLATLTVACPDLHILVTSRARLHLYGEHEIAVAPLPVPDATDVLSATESPAVQLFYERARAARADFCLTPALAPAIADICRRLDGLPLAIELAAARVKLFSPQELLQRMERRLPLLTEGAADVPPRPQGLEHAIAWSYGLLTPAQRTLFARLAVFAGSFGLAAAEAVCASPGVASTPEVWPSPGPDLSETARGVTTLLDQSLLACQATLAKGEAASKCCPNCPTRRLRDMVAAEPRFSMLSIIREFALDRLNAAGELTAIEQRHAAYFAAWAEEAAGHLEGPDQAIWLARLEQEADNLRVALRRLIETRQTTVAAHMACALGTFWQRHGRYSEGRGWLEQVLAQMDGMSVPSALRARTLQTAAMLAYPQGHWQVARAELEESLALYQTEGDASGMARALFDLGWVALDEGQWEAARRLNRDSLAMAQQTGDLVATYRAVTNLGWANLCLGLCDEAAALFGEGIALAQRLGHLRGVAVSSVNLAWVALAQGETTEAARLAREGLRLCHLLGEREALAEGLEILAVTAVAVGDTRRATRLVGAAEALWGVLHVTRPPVEQALAAHLQTLDTLRARPVEAGLGKARNPGRASSLDATVAYALHCGGVARAG